MGTETGSAKLLLDCLAEDFEARRTFQDLYGEKIYNYPLSFYRFHKEEAGDFYLYVFDKDRIFKRLKNFRGGPTLDNYLRFYVLRDLFLEWIRYKNSRRLNFAEYDDTVEYAVDENLSSREDHWQDKFENLREIFRRKEFLILKLLYLHYCELSADDLRDLARQSGRSIRDSIILVEEIRGKLGQRCLETQNMEDKLSRIYTFILSYQKRIHQIEFEIRELRPVNDDNMVNGLMMEKDELERKLAWRYSQQEQLLKKMRGTAVRTTYEDLGRLLNCPLGTVCSKVARARKSLQDHHFNGDQ